MREAILVIISFWQLMFPEPKKEDIKPETVVVESSKSGLSSKDAIEMPEMIVFPNPLDRIDLQWQPPIINPPKLTNVDP